MWRARKIDGRRRVGWGARIGPGTRLHHPIHNAPQHNKMSYITAEGDRRSVRLHKNRMRAYTAQLEQHMEDLERNKRFFTGAYIGTLRFVQWIAQSRDTEEFFAEQPLEIRERLAAKLEEIILGLESMGVDRKQTMVGLMLPRMRERMGL